MSVSEQPWYLRGRGRGSPQPRAPTAIRGQGSGKDWHEGPSVSTRDWRAAPLLWGRSPCQRDVRHRVCRINTHPLYTSCCLSGIAAQSLFLNSLLYYTGQQIVMACLPPCQGCCLPVRPGEQGVLHTVQGAPCLGMERRVGYGHKSACLPHPRLRPWRVQANRDARLHLCCCKPAAGYASTRVPQGVLSSCINGMPVLLGACGLQEVKELRVGCSVTKSTRHWCQRNRIGAGGRTSSHG